LKDKFIALQNNSLWIAGQKHGGIMVPYLMEEIGKWSDEARTLDPQAWVPNLKGQIIANGLTDWKYDGFPAYFKMSFYHGLIDDELYEYGRDNCDYSYITIKGTGNFTQGCKDTLVTFEKYTYYANIWDIYAKCYRTDPVECLWSKPVSDYFNNLTVKNQLNVD
jgi:hypothetical protein